jgi:hypothetical protein
MEKPLNIIFSEIPSYLHNSDLYKILYESKDAFPLIKKYYKDNLIIENIDDLIHLLHTLKYWCICEIPYEAYDYVLANKNILNYDQLKEEFYDFLPLIEFEILFLKKREIFNTCAEKGYLNLLKYFHQKKYSWSKDTCRLAAKNGHLIV